MQHKTSREKWSSQLGFMLAGAGSAVGLANMWRFPYVVGQYGGAAFIAIYLICLLVIGLPVFISEVSLGKAFQSSPYGVFSKVGKNSFWAHAGKILVFNGFIVSAFYSVIAGWILGYFVEAIQGNLTHFSQGVETAQHFNRLLTNPIWTLGFHAAFLLISIMIVYTGVKKGIEASSKWMMPLLLIILLALSIRGSFSPQIGKTLEFLFHPDWSLITPESILVALGHAFFTLSLGQGTMITYGSYLSKEHKVVSSCVSIALIDTVIALLSGIAIFSFVFSSGLNPDSGPRLFFQTLPLVFSQTTGGYVLGIIFFFLVSLAALSSEISALEPMIAYLMDEKKWSRRKAVICTGIGTFILGIPCALSSNLLSQYVFSGKRIDDWVIFIVMNILIPVGGAFSVLLVGKKWGVANLLNDVEVAEKGLIQKYPIIKCYLNWSIRYISPVLLLVILLHSMEII